MPPPRCRETPLCASAASCDPPCRGVATHLLSWGLRLCPIFPPRHVLFGVEELPPVIGVFDCATSVLRHVGVARLESRRASGPPKAVESRTVALLACGEHVVEASHVLARSVLPEA